MYIYFIYVGALLSIYSTPPFKIHPTAMAHNPDIICITETLPKHTHLPINECKLQVHDYDCFSNTTESNCHRGVVFM